MPGEGATKHLRRLPVYMLLDCSGSMQGDPINAVRDGMNILYTELMKDAQAVDTVWISVIKFATQADQDDLTAIDVFDPSTLNLFAEGVTSLDAAFHLLYQSIDEDLVATIGTTKGDFCPLVFMLTDGVPTDPSGYPSTAYRAPLAKVKALHGSKKPMIVALGCGSEVDEAMLHDVTDNVFLMRDVTAERLRSYFKWVSGSIVSASRAAGSGADTALAAPSIAGLTYSSGA